MKNKSFIQQIKGFTLIELLVVATIIIILSAIGLVSFQNAGRSARNAKRKADLETVRQALVLYKSDNGLYPNQSAPASNAKYNAAVTTLVSGNYISSPSPTDPKTGITGCGTGGGTICNYTYTGANNTFTLSAPLEYDNTYTVKNP